MNREMKFQAVKIWQEDDVLKPLICKRGGSSHGKLKPILTHHTVVLKCPNCSFTTLEIPEIVLNFGELLVLNEMSKRK